MSVTGWSNAHDFFQHYLDGSGADLNFDSAIAYQASAGFSSAVDQTVKAQVTASAGQATFDSGWIDFPPVGTPTSAWQDGDWQNALGHGSYRVVGQQQGDRDWSVQLQLTRRT